MKGDVNELKKLVNILMQGREAHRDITHVPQPTVTIHQEEAPLLETSELNDESLLLNDKELELIKKALDRHRGKRKRAAEELGISERTLYRKIKEYRLEE